MALRLLASVFFFPSVINFSARRCASLALGHVVVMVSCVKSDVTRFRSRALRCAEVRLSWRNCTIVMRYVCISEVGGEGASRDFAVGQSVPEKRDFDGGSL